MIGADGPLRVALLSYRSKPHCGGQGIYVRHLSRELTALGHHVEVLSGQQYLRVARNNPADLLTEPDGGWGEALSAAGVTGPIRDGVVTFALAEEGITVSRGQVVARIADLSSFGVAAQVADPSPELP